MKFKLIMALVNPECTGRVVHAAKSAGATGDVILSGRGSGAHETKSFFGLVVEDQTDIIMFLVEEHCVDQILQAIKAEAKFDEPGRGIACVLNIERVAGLESQMEKFREQARKNYL